MAPSMARRLLRDASSPATLLCLIITVGFLLVSYQSSSTERFSLRTQQRRLISRIGVDASSLSVLVNATRLMDKRVRDATRRVARLTRDNEDYKTFMNQLHKSIKQLKTQRGKLFKRQQRFIDKFLSLKKLNMVNKTFIDGIMNVESDLFGEEESSYNMY